MKIPSNIIQTGKYTIGKEFIDKKTYIPYQGYYYEINNRFFAGKEFNNNAPEIVKVTSIQSNSLLSQAANYAFRLLSRKTKLGIPNIPSIVNKSINNETRFFAKKVNINPILIKEIDKETFQKYQKDSLYQVISIEFPEGGYFSNQKSLDDADKQMPGIKDFILSEKPPD